MTTTEAVVRGLLNIAIGCVVCWLALRRLGIRRADFAVILGEAWPLLMLVLGVAACLVGISFIALVFMG